MDKQKYYLDTDLHSISDYYMNSPIVHEKPHVPLNLSGPDTYAHHYTTDPLLPPLDQRPNMKFDINMLIPKQKNNRLDNFYEFNGSFVFHWDSKKTLGELKHDIYYLEKPIIERENSVQFGKLVDLERVLNSYMDTRLMDR
jgi:hypothetical protein